MATWYVDNVASGTNAGTSWTDAWESFADIVWGGAGVVAGDTLQISGGAVSKTYTTKLTIGASGSSGSRILVQPGQAGPHNGTVIIDPNYTDECLGLPGRSYITIDGRVGAGTDCKMQLTRGSNPVVTITAATHSITLTYLEIDHVQYNATDWDRLIASSSFSTSYATFAANEPIEICYCKLHDTTDGIHLAAPNAPPAYASAFGQAAKIHHNDLYNIRDDGITLALGSVDVYNNIIRDRITPTHGHPDGIQMWGQYYRAYNNYFHGWADVAGGNAVIYIEPDGGNNMDLCNNQPTGYHIYNNVIFEDQAGSIDAFQIGLSDPDWTSIDDVLIANNTVISLSYNMHFTIGSTATALDKADVTNIRILNNIFQDCDIILVLPDDAGGTLPDFGSDGDSVSCIFDYNCVNSAIDFKWGNQTINTTDSYTNFKTATGCQDHEVTVDPSLDASGAPHNESSPVIDVGKSLAADFTTDKIDTTRPVGAGWDMGAYEYDSGAGGKFVLIFK